MNTIKDQQEISETACCCEQEFQNENGAVKNVYKCGQPELTASQLSQIEKNRKIFTRRSAIFAIN